MKTLLQTPTLEHLQPTTRNLNQTPFSFSQNYNLFQTNSTKQFGPLHNWSMMSSFY
jgi:hypothetical protein